MKPFQLASGMKTIRGVFYPTGYLVLMFASEQEARDAAGLLESQGVESDAVTLLTPSDFLHEIAGATGDDAIVPSAGTEGDTVRRFTDLAAKGHYGLMVHAPHAADSDRVMELLKDARISYGQKYRNLVIEDIVA